MKHKASIMRYLIVAMLTVLCAVCCFVGCKDDGQGNTNAEHTVTWEIAEHATVKAEGYDTLPEKVKDGTAIVFTIECDNGYEVDTVKRGDRNVTAASGKYTVTVTADVTISVTVKQAIQSVNVTSKPTKNTYYAGETVDKAGMVVEVEYVGGTKQTLNESDYRISYQGGSAATGFKVGDTYFKVSYQGKESAEVTLDSTVVAIVTLNLDGATLSDAYVNGLKANTELSDVKVENGVLSFTFAAKLTKAVALPTGADLKKGENDGDYDFTGWTDGITTLAIGEETSYNLTASFAPNLVRLNKVYYETQENVPYLILEGTFQLANNFYLYLFEGNDLVSVSDEAGEITGERGKSFTYKLDMRKLAEARTDAGKDFSGKWMDIKIVSGKDDQQQVMDIDLNRYPADFVDTSATLTWGDYVFSFATYTPSGTNAVHLKAVYNPKPSEYSFSVKGGKTAEGLPTLILEGTAASEFEGQFARVDIETMSAQYGKIENGKWTVTFVLGPDNLALNTVGYMHFNIVASETAGKGDGWKPNNDNNLGNVACTNTDFVDNGDFAYNGSDGYLISGLTLRIANDDDTAVYYVGPGKWGGFIVYGRNENKALEFVNDVHIALKVDSMTNPTKVYYVFEVRAIGSAQAYTQEEIKTLFVFGDVGSTADVFPCERIDDLGNGLYRVWYDITSYSGGQLWPNFYLINEVEEGAEQTYTKVFELRNGTNADTALYAIVGETKYTIKVEYSGACVVPTAAAAGETNPESADPDKFEEAKPEPEPEPEPKPEITYTPTDVKLEVKDNKVYFILSGTYTGEKADVESYLATIYFDFQHNNNIDGKGWSRFNKDLKRTVTVTADKWEISFDVSSIEAGAYTTHFDSTDGVGGEDSNTLNLDIADLTINGRTVTLGAVTYTLANHNGEEGVGNDGSKFWGHIGLVIENSAEPTYSPDFKTASLVVEGGKVYLTVSGTCENCTEADFKADLQNSGDWNYFPGGKDNPGQGVVTVTISEGKFTLKLDITDAAASTSVYLAHLYYGSGSAKDFEVGGSDTFTAVTVTNNGKTYTLQITSMWNRNMLSVTVADAAE